MRGCDDVLGNDILHWTMLYNDTVYRIILTDKARYYNQYTMVWYDRLWVAVVYYIISQYNITYKMIQYDTTTDHMILRSMIWCCVVSCYAIVYYMIAYSG